MAILAELFLVLAGYDSGISQVDSIHPTEKELFNRALRFGRLVASVNEVASAEYLNPKCRVIKQLVCLRYLRELAELEATIISQASGLAGSLQDSLFYSARIMADTVDKWTLLFEFSEEIVARLDLPDNLFADWVSSFIVRAASSPAARELGTEVLIAVDRAWIKELREVLVDGKPCRSAFLHHNALTDPGVLNAVSKSICQLNVAAEDDPALLRSVLEMVERNENLVTDQLKVPLDPVQCSSTLGVVHKNVSDVVRKHFLFTDETNAMWQLLRSVVLLGSPIFIANLTVANGDTEEALASFFDIANELPTSTLLHGPKMLYTENQNSEVLSIRIRLSKPLKFVLTAEQCLVYETLFGWLARVALASESIGAGNAGPTGHAFKLMFNLLWNYYQNQIDVAFAKLQAILENEDGVDVISEHDKVLKKVVQALLLDSKKYRVVLNNVIESCTSGDARPLSELTALLSELSDRHKIELMPFQKFLQS